MSEATRVLHNELVAAREVLAERVTTRAEAFKAMHAARKVASDASEAERAAESVVDRYIAALSCLGVEYPPEQVIEKEALDGHE